VLALPDNAPASALDATLQDVLDAWVAYLGRDDLPLLVVKSADRARKLLMAAFGVADGESVGVPVNTRRALSEAVKKSKGTPRFIELDADLEFVRATPGLAGMALAWAQPVAGMPAARPWPGVPLFVDYGFTLPAPLPQATPPGDATIWGLHLSGGDDGALIAFADRDLYHAAQRLLGEEGLPDLNRALAQCRRLSGEEGLAAKQRRLYDEVRLGMEAGAGLPISGSHRQWALPFGLAVRIPDEADVATFISYVRNELVDLDWLPELQPMFYVAYQLTRDPALTRRSAENLARWIVAPIGPDFTDDEVTHAVLGILKAAEYIGVRWYTDPERARWYEDLMRERYGPNHDAYRMAFDAPLRTGAQPALAGVADD
jgi:hypothetical protein